MNEKLRFQSSPVDFKAIFCLLNGSENESRLFIYIYIYLEREREREKENEQSVGGREEGEVTNRVRHREVRIISSGAARTMKQEGRM